MLEKGGGLIFFVFLILITAATANAQTDLDRALQAIDEKTLRAHIGFLSDDLLGGRAPGSAGSVLAQRYITSQMQLIGLRPGIGDTVYHQRFDVVEINLEPGMHLKISGKQGNLELKYYDQFIAFPGEHKEKIRLENAELVFAGYGIRAPEYEWDDFKDVDVQGKVLLIMNNDPDTGDPDFFGGKARLYYGRWDYKYEQAARMGAIGAIIIHTTASAGYPWKVVQTSWSGTQFELPRTEESGLVYKGWVTGEVAHRIAGLAGKNLDKLRSAAEERRFKPVPLGLTVNAGLAAGYRTVKAANVVGILPGSDPELRKQAVVFTAHYDHLGIGKAAQGDSIYNGALDNASGVASILSLAQAFSQLNSAPRRSLVFIAVDGEESGLLGSQYYAENPTFVPGQIAANINIDGANIWGKTRDVAIVGSGKSTIDEVVKEAAKTQGRIVLPDLMPEQGSFYRADQFNFAKIGVPALYLDTGQDFIGRPQGWGKKSVEHWIATHYHQPSDEYEPDWDLSGHIEDLVLIFQVARRLANDDRMPAWLPGDEFEAVRLKATGEKR